VSGKTEYVLDSTALIALLSREPGYEKIAELLDTSAISAVNLAETVHKLVQKGSAPSVVERLLRELHLKIEAWSEDLAYQSADFARYGHSHGLSLGDRACLTLAKHLGSTAVTADRVWRRSPSLGVPLLIFR
jgi:ribonuclease VapC